MATLEKLQQLSSAHCVLLAVQYATESNISALRALTALRDAELPFELTLSILLTYLPEELEPLTYVEYLNELATHSRNPGPDPAAVIDVSSLEELSNSRAKKRRRALEFIPIINPIYATETELDIFSHFLIHRAHRIDSQTGLLDLVPQLVGPFLGHSEYLRTWFISTALPLLRLSYEYYPQNPAGSLDNFAQLRGRDAIELLLSNAKHTHAADIEIVGRDLKGLLSPWLCGVEDRKRRLLPHGGRRGSEVDETLVRTDDWGSLWRWLFDTSEYHLQFVTTAFCSWDGPDDMDLGGFEEGRDYVDDQLQRKLEMSYAQTAMAVIYNVKKADKSTFKLVRTLLDRVCELFSVDTLSDRDIEAASNLPHYDTENHMFRAMGSTWLRESRYGNTLLLNSEHSLTHGTKERVEQLRLVVASAMILLSFGHDMTVQELADISIRDDKDNQYALLQKITHSLVASKKDKDQWTLIRSKLLWLWDWGDHEQLQYAVDDRFAHGIFGMLTHTEFENEILKALIEGGQFELAVQIYIRPVADKPPLALSRVEQTVLESAMSHYDNASNGNRSRGGMKRADDILRAFAPQFPHSSRFQRAQALIKATHAMSYYSLILQHGVPFQPVAIRVSENPLSLIRKLLAQNEGSYTKLDDLIAIGQNLTIAMPSTLLDEEAKENTNLSTNEHKTEIAERRVIGMAIEAALEEDDFETAYSYVVNRLTPKESTTTPSIQPHQFSLSPTAPENDDDHSTDDIAWRAAVRAGRYTSSPLSTSWTQPQSTAHPSLRRLEQRMELLSQALLLAPPHHLEEVLRVWLDCETEMTTLLAQEADVEQRFNDAADKKLPGTFINDSITVQPRREIGRGANEEAPMGLFDVARGAAAAFSKSAFPLHAGARAQGEQAQAQAQGRSSMSSSRVSMDLSDSDSLRGQDERVRKRDMMASVASGALNTGTGALASGLGWMLGAKPVHEQERE